MRSAWVRAGVARVLGRGVESGKFKNLGVSPLGFSILEADARSGLLGVRTASPSAFFADCKTRGAGGWAEPSSSSAKACSSVASPAYAVQARGLVVLAGGGLSARPAAPEAVAGSPPGASAAVVRLSRPVGARGMSKKASKGAKVASKGGYEIGVEKVLYSCPRPNRFRLLTAAVSTYGAFSSWAFWNHFYGGGLPTLTGGEAPAIYGVVVTVGCVMSIVGLGVAYQHARRHVARLSVVPGKVVDEVIITSHTMAGGEITKSFLPHQIDRSEDLAPKGSTLPMTKPWERFRVQGEYGFFLLDDQGEVFDTQALNSVLHGRPVPKAGQAPARKR